jgi:DNA ligase-1
MADKTVSQAIANAYRESKEEVWKCYQKEGDMGIVVAKLNEKLKIKSEKLSVEKVFETLTEIAKTSGEGTVEKRITLFQSLLERMDPLEAKYVVRIALRNTRLGIGDPTILDALALAILGDRSNRKLLEKAYNETSDLGLIGITLLEKGLPAVQKLTVQVGHPIRSELCERLPNPETTKRRRKHGIEEMAKQLPLRAFVFDILYADGKSLVDLPLLERMKILKNILHGEDILIPAPGKVLHKPEELQLMLDDSISKGLEGVVVKRVDSPYEAGGRNFNWVKLKRHSSGELQDTIDCVILGYIFGKGKRTAFGAGALLVGVYDKEKDEFVTVSRIGTGLSDEEWKSIKEKTHGLELDHKPARVNSLITPSVWVKPEIVIEVLADEITRSPMHTAGAKGTGGPAIGGTAGAKRNEEATEEREAGYALRFPRLITFRDRDKKAEDATTIEELIKMYNSQGKK